MAITLRRDTVAEVIRRVLSGGDHRDVVVDLVDAAFVSDALNFFEQVAVAKIRDQHITPDWYRDNFLSTSLDKDDIAWNSGLNVKTITNKHRSSRRQIVIDEAMDHYDKFIDLVESLSDDSVNIDLALTLRGVTVHLNLNESLVVINAIAVRRAAIRGGAWSALGKNVEAPLMETMCRIFGVGAEYFTRALDTDNSLREVDYFLISPNGNTAKCEVKLMGQGNPESADAIHARQSDVFVASTLSDLNKQQLDEAGILWTELQVPNGYLRFGQTLSRLGIPHTPVDGRSDNVGRIEAAIQRTLLL